MGNNNKVPLGTFRRKPNEKHNIHTFEITRQNGTYYSMAYEDMVPLFIAGRSERPIGSRESIDPLHVVNSFHGVKMPDCIMLQFNVDPKRCIFVTTTTLGIIELIDADIKSTNAWHKVQD